MENAIAKDGFWDNPDAAQIVLKEKGQLQSSVTEIQEAQQACDDWKELLELSPNDQSVMDEATQSLTDLKGKTDALRLQAMLSGEADRNDCFLEIHAGAGGTEAQDWAEMLVRMYSRWAEKKGYKVSVIETSPGEEAGLKSATLHIKAAGSASFAYGWLKKESGVHRLVRISPYDSSGRRHTSFASVWVYPEIDQTIKIDIEDKDLRVDTYRASGAGGQHVNKTDSAVRMTHIPTGIVVQCQTDRSQHRNRAQAMNMLRARLYEFELRKRETEASESRDNSDIGWGNQIRSYVLQPYQLVKDARTGVEVGNTGAVLDGDIDPFLWGMLNKKKDSAG